MLFNLYRNLDLFSQTPSLKISGRSIASTNFGSFVGLTTIFCLITGIVFILNDYFQHSSYKVNSFVDNSARPNIDLKNVKLGFQITNYLGKRFPDRERLFSFQAKYWDIHIPVDETYNTKVSHEKINMIKCNEYKSYHKDMEKYEKISRKLLCLDLENLNRNLTGVYGNIGG